jgi:hypothetical protein
MISLSSCPIPLAGTITPKTLTMRGYAFVHTFVLLTSTQFCSNVFCCRFADVCPQQPVHQTELYSLVRSTTSVASTTESLSYHGTYEFTHQPITQSPTAAPTAASKAQGPAKPPAEDLKVFFDVQLLLE